MEDRLCYHLGLNKHRFINNKANFRVINQIQHTKKERKDLGESVSMKLTHKDVPCSSKSRHDTAFRLRSVAIFD